MQREEKPPTGTSGFFCELRRRKVYRVAAAYAVVGWLLIQVAATVFPPLDVPAWTLRALIIAVLAGFPIALVLGWAFDIGPHGFEKTAAPVEAEDCPPALRPRRRNMYVLALIGIVIAGVAGFFLLSNLKPERKLAKSIAVLPFDSFSDDKENEHFADGIQDDVLTSLAKIGDLKVISRTSVMRYRGAEHNIREIGRALGVGAILEGSVRREGNRVRVNVQLINAATDEHLWAEVYERNLTDVFAIQTALAQEIASQLKATLSPDEKARMETKPTQNGDAYLLYVQAQSIANGADTEKRKTAVPMFEQAIALDPSFALAYAQLSRLQSWLYQSIDPIPARLEKARTAADEALRLQPDLPEAHMAKGFFHYYGERDYDAALREFATARKGLPNEAGIFRAIAAIERRQGKWDASTRHYRRAVSLNPNDAVLIENLALNHMSLRDYPNAANTFDRAIALAPDAFEIKAERAWVDVHWRGDFTRFRELFETPEGANVSPVATLARFNVLFFERKFEQALEALVASPFPNLRGETSTPLPKAFLAAQVYRAMGDHDRARAAYEEARVMAQRALVEAPGDASRHALMGLIEAGLGRKEEAVRSGERAVELLPETVDAFDGPILVISLARIYTFVGEHEMAISRLEHSLSTPAGVTVNELKFDPTWDALRQHPQFQKLIAQ